MSYEFFSLSGRIPAEMIDETLCMADLQEQSRQFENLLSCLSSVFYRCEIAAPWKMLFASDGVQQVTGYEAHEFLEIPYAKLVVTADLAEMAHSIEKAIATRRHFDITYRIKHRSGGIRWVQERGTPVFDKNGKPMFLEGIIGDITDRRKHEIAGEAAQRDAELSNARLLRMLESTLDCVVKFDKDWNYTFCNSRAASELTCEGNAIELYPDVFATPLGKKIMRAAERQESLHSEGYLKRFGKWFEVYLSPDDDGLTLFFRDISDRKKAQRVLERKARTLQKTIDSIPHMVWITRPDGHHEHYNKLWYKFTGKSPGECDGTGWNQMFHPDDRERAWQIWNRSLATGEPYEIEYRLRHRSGEFRWVQGRAWAQRDNDGEIVRWYGTCTDIHDQVMTRDAMQESRSIQANIMESTTDCIKIIDPHGIILDMNKSGCLSLGLDDKEEVVGKSWASLWPEKGQKAVEQAIGLALQGKAARFTGFCPTAKNNPRWWDVAVSPIVDDNGKINKLLGVSRDITDLRESAEQLRTASETDELTGLPNRRAFNRQLRKIEAMAKSRGETVGLILLDLDHFKHVNDTLGHLAGDHLLRVLGKRLQSSMKDVGYVARLGGDEFAALVHPIRNEQELVSAATHFHGQIENPITYSGHCINGGMTIGCALYPRDATDLRGLLKCADAALNDLKAHGRGGIQIYTDQMLRNAEQSAKQLNLARQVVVKDMVEPHYQPKVRLEDRKLIGFEALLRWWCPSQGLQMPSSVAEAFKDYEMATKIGGLMQDRICADLAEWLRLGADVVPVSINASPVEFLRDDFSERLLGKVSRWNVPPHLIEIEVTEHVFLERGAHYVSRALNRLRSAGVRIALDDFGTGHSSLAHLRDLPVNTLKLDRSFVGTMLTDPEMEAIVRSISTLAPKLSLDVVAEGVETEDHVKALRQSGCKFGQGYLFGKAMCASEVSRKLSRAA